MAIVLLFMAASSTFAAEKTKENAQSQCVVEAFQEYNSAKLKRIEQMGVDLSIEGVRARRRDVEAYCARFVVCLATPDLAKGATFQKCLDDEDEDRLGEGKQRRARP
ncbi:MULTISPECIES: hypothetical protein [unclassified Bradyrhizobium]|uniref:hypothetical protein n=1 Tax=unclassified Bradyrhizobium TaxID=2631580 RepID=UPI002915F512|nr:MULTISPECIES: hypothetical protein [unclassified Bradyrhizobium]